MSGMIGVVAGRWGRMKLSGKVASRQVGGAGRQADGLVAVALVV